MTTGLATGWRTRMLAAGLAGMASATSAAAQKIGEAPDIAIPWLRYISALAVCLLLALGAAFALKARRGGSNLATPTVWARPMRWLAQFSDAETKRLRLVETLRLNAQVDLCIVRCDGRDFALAVTSQSVSILPLINASCAAPTVP